MVNCVAKSIHVFAITDGTVEIQIRHEGLENGTTSHVITADAARELAAELEQCATDSEED